MIPYLIAAIVGLVIGLPIVFFMGYTIGSDEVQKTLIKERKEHEEKLRRALENSAMWSREYHSLKRELTCQGCNIKV